MGKKTWANLAGTWRNVKAVWLNVNGTWKKVVPKGNMNGIWKEFISYYDEIVFLTYSEGDTENLLKIDSKGDVVTSLQVLTLYFYPYGRIYATPRCIVDGVLYLGGFLGISQFYDGKTNEVKEIAGAKEGLLYVDSENNIITGTKDLNDRPILSKVSPGGTKLFSQQVSEVDARIAYATVDSANEIYITNSAWQGSVEKRKKEDGTLIWSKGLMGPYFMHFLKWSGRYIFVSFYRQPGWTGGEFKGIKRILPSGSEVEIEVKYGSTSYTPDSLAFDVGGNIYITYNSQVLEKRDSTGLNIIWQKIEPDIISVTVTQNNFLYVTFKTGYVGKYDTNGNLIWKKAILSGEQKFIGAPMANY